jgi:hypothetical protein
MVCSQETQWFATKKVLDHFGGGFGMGKVQKPPNTMVVVRQNSSRP